MTLFQSKSRYGAMGRHASDEVSRVVEALISELETEQFDEHTQVAVAREGCCVTVYVSGLVELAEILDDAFEPSRFLRARPREDAVEVLTWVAQGRLAAVRALAWLPDASAWEVDVFRVATR
ncbi:MAG: hypothetical protein JNM17_34275 [Archangium sp.]|nr:hypothetical protein [Archangium sp.]